MCHPLHFIRDVMQTWGGNFCTASCEQLHVSSKSRAVKHKALRFLCRSGNGPGRARVICYRSGICWEYRCIPLTFDTANVRPRPRWLFECYGKTDSSSTVKNRVGVEIHECNDSHRWLQNYSVSQPDLTWHACRRLAGICFRLKTASHVTYSFRHMFILNRRHLLKHRGKKIKMCLLAPPHLL